MQIVLSLEKKAFLEACHAKTRDRRVADRIKAVLLRYEGWSMAQISQALRIHLETVRTHLNEYHASQKLKPENGGSMSKLSATQTAELMAHLQRVTYLKASNICAYVLKKEGVSYTVQGVTSWLHQQGFSFKKPAATPAKADPAKQEAFIQVYEDLLGAVCGDEPILFSDGVHPTMVTKVSCGWIRTGTRKPIATTASRMRLNLMGSLDLTQMSLHTTSHETLKSQAMEDHFQQVRNAYPANSIEVLHLTLEFAPPCSQDQLDFG